MALRTNPYEAPLHVEKGDAHAAARTVISAGCFLVMTICGVFLVGNLLDWDAVDRLSFVPPNASDAPIIGWFAIHLLANLANGLGVYYRRYGWVVLGLGSMVISTIVVALIM